MKLSVAVVLIAAASAVLVGPTPAERHGKALRGHVGNEALLDDRWLKRADKEEKGNKQREKRVKEKGEGGKIGKQSKDKKKKAKKAKKAKKSKEQKSGETTEGGGVSTVPATEPSVTTTSPTSPDDEETENTASGVGNLSTQRYYSSSDSSVTDSNDGVEKVIQQGLPWTVQSINAGVTEGYSDCSGLVSDLMNATNLLAAKRIRFYAANEDIIFVRPADQIATKEQEGGEDSGESSFETNNQVEGVDEVDFIKSNGKMVYAAYGDTILAWDAITGQMISETIMPMPESDNVNCGGHSKPTPEPKPEEDDEAEEEEIEIDEMEVGEPAAVVEKKSIIADPCPRAHIHGLLLHSDRLVAFVGGYTTQSEERPILSDYGLTVIKVFDTASLVEVVLEEGSVRKEMKQVSEQVLPGGYRNGRAIGSRVHAVTTSNVNTWDHLERHLFRGNERYSGMSKDEYVSAATQLAKDKAVPDFVAKFLQELKNRHKGTCADIVQVSVFQTGNLDPSKHAWWGRRGILGGVAEVSSFDVGAPVDPSPEGSGPDVLVAETSTAFVSNPWRTTVYATAEKLFIATVGYDEDEDEEWEYIDSTIVYAYELPSGESSVAETAKAVGVGKVVGTVLNQFSMDFFKDHLRIATSTEARWGCVNQMDTESELEEGDEVGPVRCEWEMIREPHNQVAVLALPQGGGADAGGGVMETVGRTPRLGKPRESITAVRFMEDLGFAATFERRDPLISIDLGNPKKPSVLGELDISGFSNYLHPTRDGTKTFLAVGQDADPVTGQQTGLQITLFGFENKTAPRALAIKPAEEEDEDDQWSSSETQWEHKSFRYLSSGVALLPATVHGRWKVDEATGQKKYKFFDGFMVYDVDTTPGSESIEERFRVNLADPKNWNNGWGRCHYHGYLPARSVVIDGNAMLMKGHGAQTYSLETNEWLWTLDFDANLPKGQCWGYWG